MQLWRYDAADDNDGRISASAPSPPPLWGLMASFVAYAPAPWHVCIYVQNDGRHELHHIPISNIMVTGISNESTNNRMIHIVRVSISDSYIDMDIGLLFTYC